MGETATCHVCGATIKVTRRDHPDTFGNVIYAYAMVCPANPGHVGSQYAVAVGAARRNNEPPPRRTAVRSSSGKSAGGY